MAIVLESLLALPDENARRQFLEAQADALDDAACQALADALKAQADHYLRAEIQTSFQFARLLIDWGAFTHNPFHRALGLRAEANALSIGLGHYREALEKYNEAAQIYREHGRTLDEAKAQIGKLFPLANLGRYDEAIACGEWVADVLAAHGEQHAQATVMLNLGITYGRRAEDAQALVWFDRASAVYKSLGAFEWYWAEQNRAEVLRNLGRFDASIQASQTALKALQEAGQKTEAARALQNLSITYIVQGQYNEAIRLLDQANTIFRENNQPRGMLETALLMSDCHLQLCQFRQALDRVLQARAQFISTDARFDIGQTYLSEALAHTGLNRHEDAGRALAEARRLFAAEGNIVWIATTDLELAQALQRQGHAQETYDLAMACAKIFRLRSLPVKRAQARLVAAQAALALGQQVRATQLANEALSIAQDKEIPWLAYSAYVLLGKLAQESGDHTRALEACELAIQNLEHLRGRMMVEYRAEYLEDKQAVYEQAVALCLEAHQPEAALVYAERAKSRSLLDLLAYRLDLSVRARQAGDEALVQELTALRAERDQLVRRTESQLLETRNPLEPSDASPARLTTLEKQITEQWHTLLVRNADYAREADLWQVRTAPAQDFLAADETLLEYFVVRDQLIVFTVSSTQVSVQPLPASLPQIQALVRNLWLNLKTVPESPTERTASLARNAQQMLQRLHTALMGPLHIPEGQRMLIVPHGPLHYVPFHALFDGTEPNCPYLIQRHEVSYLPSSSVLAYCRKPVDADATGAKTDASVTGRHVTTFGYSRGGQLPQTVEEAQAVAQLWSGRAFVEAEATLDQLREAAPISDVLHLAMHGDYRADNPLFSGLLFADGSLTTLDTFNLRLRASLVTLSACQTGRNALSGGDELLGLMRGFLGAGAASLVLSLWRAEDQSTAQLMRTFYTQLRAGQSKAAALRAAQCELLQAHAHPYFWAPFLLVGDTAAL